MIKKVIPPAADMDAVVTPSSGNVFTDLGFGPGEAVVMGLRADLIARVSDLLRGKWDKFSLDMLITLAARAGRKVELAIC